MIERMNNALLGMYVRTVSRLNALKVVRDERGQTFTDYLIVIALVIGLLALIGPTTKETVNQISVSLFNQMTSVVAKLWS